MDELNEILGQGWCVYGIYGWEGQIRVFLIRDDGENITTTADSIEQALAEAVEEMRIYAKSI